MLSAGVWVELSDGNIRNDHIYLWQVLSFFPPDSVGGPNVRYASPHKITVQFNPGLKIQTDIAGGTKRFLRERGAVRDFFEQSSAKGGDVVLISKLGERRFEFELMRR